MAEKQEKKKKKTEPEAEEGALVSAAKAIGAAAGKVAAMAGAALEPKVPSPPKVKIPKLQPKNKTRMPRRQKKALQKAAARKG
jgi:hypothetical protein